MSLNIIKASKGNFFVVVFKNMLTLPKKHTSSIILCLVLVLVLVLIPKKKVNKACKSQI